MGYIKKEAELIFERSLKALGLEEDTKTDPRIMKAIIKEFRLDDFKSANKQFDKIFQNVISKPQKLAPFFLDIKNGITSKHPAVIEFVELALQKNWFKPSEHIIRSVHVIYILEILTATMCNDHDFFLEIQKHYKEKEKICGIDSRHILGSFKCALGITHNLFGTIKAFLVDPGMIYFQIQRGLSKTLFSKKELKKLYKNGTLNYIEYKMLWPIHKYGLEHLHALIRINIYEAGITEFENNLKANSICAHELSEDIRNNPPQTLFEIKNVTPENYSNEFYKSITKTNNRFPVFKFSQGWVSLYTTWNMAFILGNVDNLDIMFPKLLIPSMINADHDNYLGARIISLWLAVNHYLFRKYDREESPEPKNKLEMAKAWGEINKKYAFALAERELHEDSRIIVKSYNRFFSQPFYNLLKIVKIFILKN